MSSEDFYFTGNPQITFFKTTFKRSTNFTIQELCCFCDKEIKNNFLFYHEECKTKRFNAIDKILITDLAHLIINKFYDT
jgi:hypothetical protein